MYKYIFCLFAFCCSFFLRANSVPVLSLNDGQNQQNYALKQDSDLDRKLEQFSKNILKLHQTNSNLENEISSLRGLIEAQNNEISNLKKKQRSLYIELDNLKNSKPENKEQNLDPVTQSIKEYQDAVNLVLKDKNYAQAIVHFRKFIKENPKSIYVGNSRYWLGQLLYNEKKIKEAKEQFLLVVKNHPNSNKHSDALLKLALLAQIEGNNSLAKKYYTRILKDHPKSKSAKIAQEKVATL